MLRASRWVGARYGWYKRLFGAGNCWYYPPLRAWHGSWTRKRRGRWRRSTASSAPFSHHLLKNRVVCCNVLQLLRASGFDQLRLPDIFFKFPLKTACLCRSSLITGHLCDIFPMHKDQYFKFNFHCCSVLSIGNKFLLQFLVFVQRLLELFFRDNVW